MGVALRAVGAPEELAAAATEMRSIYLDVITFKTELSWSGALEYAETTSSWRDQLDAWLDAVERDA